MFCSEADTVREFTYLPVRVSTGVGCEATVTARARFWWVRFRECGKLLRGNRFVLRLKRTVYLNFVRLVFLYRGEARCM